VASVLLLPPVGAVGKGPPEGVGEGTETAAPHVPPQAKVRSAPPGQSQRPDPAPHRAPAQVEAPGEAAPPGPPAEAPPAWTPGSAHARGTTPAHGGHHSSAPSPSSAPAGPAERAPDSSSPGDDAQGGGDVPSGSDPEPTHAPDTGGAVERSSGGDGGAVAGEIDSFAGDDTTELMPDAGPATLPFTGFELMLMASFGLAAVAAGAALRRRARQGRA
jgi:hypothetical protein